MLQRMVATAVITALVVGGGILAYQRLLPPREQASGPIYAAAPVRRGDIRVVVEGFGPLYPVFSSDIQASAGGFVEAIYIDRGQRVEAGQLVARIRNDELAYEVNQLAFDLERGRLELASLLNLRPEEVTQVDPNRGIEITTPIAGRIFEVQIKRNDTVSVGTLVARVVDDSHFVMVAELSAAEVRPVAEGQTALLRVAGFDGTVSARVTVVDRTPIPQEDHFVFRVTIEGKNPGLLRPGQEVALTIETAQGPVQVVKPQRIDRYGLETVIRSPAEGTVTDLRVREGAQVRAGETVAVLGGEATARYIRRRQLDIRELELKLAQKQEVRENLEVRSPISGVVAWVGPRPGMRIEQGWGIAGIFDASKMMLNFQADELDVVHLKEGQRAEITVDAVPGRSFPAQVTRVDMMGKTEEGVTTYMVALEVTETDELKPGMTGNVSIFVAEKKDVLLVPTEAVFEHDGMPAVEVLVDGRPVVVPVEIGLVNARWTEVVSGIEEGQQVVTGSPLDRLDSERLDRERPPTVIPGPGPG